MIKGETSGFSRGPKSAALECFALRIPLYTYKILPTPDLQIRAKFINNHHTEKSNYNIKKSHLLVSPPVIFSPGKFLSTVNTI